MKLGVHVIKFDNPRGGAAIADEMKAVAQVAEASGVSWLSVADHYFQMDEWNNAEDAMLEGYTTLGYLAAHTSTVQLGMLVTGVTYRHPGVLAKIVTTLDVLSGGRAVLAIGAAWYEREHRGLGVAFPPVAERFERLEETLQICRQMWDPHNNGPFEGKHYQLAETICSPAPLSQPIPPIMIGGMGERKTLRLVAQYADSCNLLADSEEVVAHKLDVLRKHCDEVGRDYAEITTTVAYTGQDLNSRDVDGFTEKMSGFARQGVDTVMIMPPDSEPARWMDDLCAPVAARLAELG